MDRRVLHLDPQAVGASAARRYQQAEAGDGDECRQRPQRFSLSDFVALTA